MVKRGDIYYADLSPVVGSEQGGMRPVLKEILRVEFYRLCSTTFK